MIIDFQKARLERGLPVLETAGVFDVQETEGVLEAASDEQLAIEEMDSDEMSFDVPEWAESVIVARYTEYDERGSDPQSGYYRSKVVKSLLLGYSKHQRRLFSELRKCCKKHELTAFLADEGVEHREDYSMGKGLYLTDKDFNFHGWSVRKIMFYPNYDKSSMVAQALSGEIIVVD